MNDILTRCLNLASEATSLRTSVEFRASFGMCDGHLTEAHLSLYRAQRAAKSAADAIDRLVVKADSHLATKVAAE